MSTLRAVTTPANGAVTRVYCRVCTSRRTFASAAPVFASADSYVARFWSSSWPVTAPSLASDCQRARSAFARLSAARVCASCDCAC